MVAQFQIVHFPEVLIHQITQYLCVAGVMSESEGGAH